MGPPLVLDIGIEERAVIPKLKSVSSFGNGTVDDRWTRWLTPVTPRGYPYESGILSQVHIRPAIARLWADPPGKTISEWQA